MDDLEHSNIRAILLKEARALLAENAKFSVKSLLTKCDVSREVFRQHFAGKADLLTALAGQDIKDLSHILETAQPMVQNLRATACGTVAPVPVIDRPVAERPVADPPVADQWLERRLRVFERTLGALEKRQEKSEQNILQQIALLNERLAVPQAAPEPAPQVIQEAQPVEPVRVFVPEPQAVETAPDPVAEPVLSPSVLAHIEEIQDDAAQRASEKEIADFIAHARQAARKAAAPAETAPPKARKSPWLAWGGAGVALILLLGMGLLLADRALGHNAPPVGAGVVHRQVATQGIPRLMALADSGDATAQTMLALAYLRGAGVASDDAAAKRWSEAAAIQGQPVAEYLLGALYLENNGDQSAAVRWFSAAARQGNIKAMHNLAIAYSQGTGIAQDSAQAVTWFVRAAEQGYRDSEFDLGVLYERGEGVPQDAVAALKWYRIAASQGDQPSALRAQFLMTQLNAVEVNSAMDEAAAFVPKPAQTRANEAPMLKG